MNTGLNNLDNVFDIEKPHLVVLTGIVIVDLLSGDIANNVCLSNSRYEVLEVVNCFKEYLIKRLVVNEANVNYKKWTFKDEYSEFELKQIGQAIVDLIEVTKRLPRIIENDLWDFNDLEKYIYKFVNRYADREEIRSLVVIDICPFNSFFSKKDKRIYKYKRFVRNLQGYAKKFNIPILMVCTNETILNDIKKYVDVIIKAENKEEDILNIDIIEKDIVTSSCKLKYNSIVRKFEDCY